MLKELFANNKNIIINTDIDGFLCGMLLQKYYDCKVVGFSDSRDTIWVTPEIQDIYSPIYIDIYINRPDVICIDQHIISFNKEHHLKIQQYGTKINPNLERNRTFVGDMGSDYYHKYPFGTVHYLLSLMAKEGLQVDFPRLSLEYAVPIPDSTQKLAMCQGQILLRADDALYSTLSPYRENALDWWNWLDPNNNSIAIRRIKQFINTCEIAKAKEYKKNIGDFFLALGCDGQDGSFKNITDKEGNLLSKVKKYNDIITLTMAMDLNIPTKYVIHKGVYENQYSYPHSDMSFLNSDRLYSYAFIFGPKPKKPNFSYTYDMK
jgi:hypothetical protein